MSDAPVGPVTQIVMDVKQTAGGNVTGTWSGKAVRWDGTCWPALGATPTGSVQGTYTQIRIAMTVEAVGVFQGQKISSSEIRGTFDTCTAVYGVRFTLVNAPSGG